MIELVADRFLSSGARWIDIATGGAVRLRVTAAGTASQQFVWADRCATLSLMRHPLLNALVDYGALDSRRLFEAYVTGEAVHASPAAAERLQRHAARFLQSRGLTLTTQLARIVMRELAEPTSAPGSAVELVGPREGRGRPLGVVLQPRRILNHLDEVLNDAVPGGVNVVDVSGPQRSGVQTLSVLIARVARLQGYVPVAAGMFGMFPHLAEVLRERHVALLSIGPATSRQRGALAAGVARIGASSARRHILVRFWREPEPSRRALAMDRLGVTAMSAMVFVEPATGPSPEELFEAIRYADGRPGRLVEYLRGFRVDPRMARATLVHETTPAYVVAHEPAAPASQRRMGTVLLRARARATRLAACGRHAEARRLLARAIRVLEARREHDHAASCAASLAWILRDRGRSSDAADAFNRARQLAGESCAGIEASIGVGIVWTDQARLLEAEAALRSAHAAAEVLHATEIARRASVALARCLLWQARQAEAAAVLEPTLTADAPVDAWALAARIRVATNDMRRALTAAGEAVARADRSTTAREVAVAACALAAARAASGDLDAAREAVGRGLQAAAAAHLPLAALRLRLVLLKILRVSPSTTREATRLAERLRVVTARDVPLLLRRELAAACDPPSSSGVAAATRSWTALSEFLEIAQAASDDQSAAVKICDAVCERLRASTAVIVCAHPDVRVIAQAGRPWRGDYQLALRAITSGIRAESIAEPREFAVAIKYGIDRIAAFVCRWTAGAAFDDVIAIGVAEAAALASAPSVRGIMDRTQPGQPDSSWSELIGTSPAASALRDAIVRAARAPFPVLVEGESGSGKELVARAIHRFGSRRDRRLCAVNCAAIADDLLEAELFGHARGAFTGASVDRAGIFEEADGGTLFLDEIAELSARAQAKLLRVLQDGEVRRIGENVPRRVDTRVIAATNRRLDQEVEGGRFRADLRFRLDVIRIAVPPLRDRATDIPQLASHFWQEASARLKSRATLAPETVAALARYDWPGNVRELQNAIASLAVHAPHRGRILPSMLPSHLARAGVSEGTTFESAREEFERRFVRAALAQANGHRARAARSLGVTRQGLAKMMRRLKIE
jgi:DNA-binding NtrC family response regulator/tetratricopeptide (TPR) repeat protein